MGVSRTYNSTATPLHQLAMPVPAVYTRPFFIWFFSKKRKGDDQTPESIKK